MIGILVLVYYVWTRPPPPPDPLATLVRRHEAIEQRLTTLERHARPVARPRGQRRPPALVSPTPVTLSPQYKMNPPLMNALFHRIETKVQQVMLDVDSFKHCKVMFADGFWGAHFPPRERFVPCPIACEYVYGRNPEDARTADGVVYHQPNFGGFLPHKPVGQRWIALQFEPENIHRRLVDPSILKQVDATATYSLASDIPLTYWGDYVFDTDAFTHAVSFASKKKSAIFMQYACSTPTKREDYVRKLMP